MTKILRTSTAHNQCSALRALAGVLVGPSCGVWVAAWRPLGASSGPLGGLLGLRARNVRSGPPSGHSLGTVLGAFCASGRRLGPSWCTFGPFGDPLGGLLGRPGATLGASWAVLARGEAEKARTPKFLKNVWEIHDFCLLGLSWERSWRPFGASRRPLGPSGGRQGVLDRSFGDSGPSWIVLGASWGTLGPSWDFFRLRNSPGGAA